MTDREVFESFLFAMIGGRFDEAAGFLHEEVVWHLPPFANQAPFEGKPAVYEFMSTAQSQFYQPGTLRIEPKLWVVEDGHASCLARMSATTRRGNPYDNQYAFFATLENALLTEVWELMDTSHFQTQLRA